jgi:SAM-dependent methyltransferase
MQIIGSAERICPMESLYQHDLAHVQARAFGKLAQGAAAKIVRRLRSSSARIRRVMDVGCGSGFLIKALADAGFEVTGINISAELLELARANAPKAHFVLASAYDVQIRALRRGCCLGEPLTYHTEGAEADNLISRFFQRVAEAVPAGGMLIFDVIGLGTLSGWPDLEIGPY